MDERQLHATPLKTPFGSIAMALSGGGFRASSFSIGTMSYLHHLRYGDGPGDQRLLDRVSFISSASGGTFTGILYSAYARKGIPFAQVYRDMLHFMKGETLLEEVLTLLNDDAEWEHLDKSRNLINAFARTYDKKLFGGETFGVYWGEGVGAASAGAGLAGAAGTSAGAGTAVAGAGTASAGAGTASAGAGLAGAGRDIEVCFNATEFYRGLSFRWQIGSSAGMTGNQYIFFDSQSETALAALKKIKLGDIMASSSCFPAGFEPIVYPRDFSYPATRDKKDEGLSPENLQQAVLITDYDNRQRQLDCSIGLMDGGVDDNQGLYSLMLADQRRRRNDKDKGFDLIMVTDVASYFMDPYIPPPAVVKGDLRKKRIADVIRGLNRDIKGLSKLLKTGAIVGVLMLLAAIGLIVFAEQGRISNIGFLLLSPAILLLLIVVFIVGYQKGNPLFSRLSGIFGASDKELADDIKEGVPALENFSDEALRSLLKFFKGTRIGVLEQMVKARINSMLSMVLDINLKQTRRLIFDIFYGSFYGEDVWRNRRVFNVIYELSLLNVTSRGATIKNKFEGAAKKYPLPPSGGTDGLKTVPGGTVGGTTGVGGPSAPGEPSAVAAATDSWARDCEDLLLKDCKALNSIGEEARTMGTTLWYDHADAASDRMKKVVACGQFTACAKLVEYVLVLDRILQSEAELPFEKRTVQLDPAALAIFVSVKGQILRDWERFKKEPYFLYEMMGV